MDISLRKAMKEEKIYKSWLSYNVLENKKILEVYQEKFMSIGLKGEGVIINSIKEELQRAIPSIFANDKISFSQDLNNKFLVISKIDECSIIQEELGQDEIDKVSEEGFIIKTCHNQRERIIITGKSDKGLLYGIFSFIRLLTMTSSLDDIYIINNPANKLRIINHWDN